MDSFNELFCRFAVRGFGEMIGVHEMDAYVVLEYFGHEPGDGSANSGNQMHDALASGFLVQSAFDGLDLSSNPLDPGPEFFLFSNSVADGTKIGYPPILVKGAVRSKVKVRGSGFEVLLFIRPRAFVTVNGER
jgi:hypothetical protein